MAMMTINNTSKSGNGASCKELISSSNGCPSWKLYENPFYYSQHNQLKWQSQSEQNKNHLHRLQLPLSARKIAASFWDLTFFRPTMESELDAARAQIAGLKAELEKERKARKKMESMNKRLAKEVAEERKRREVTERSCEDLAGEITTGKAEIDRKRREMEEERKMMRVAEVLREGRVQMKLNEAKILLEEKISELEGSKQSKTESSSSSVSCNTEQINKEYNLPEVAAALALKPSTAVQRRAPEGAENPHIKRGVKGFVEFPKVVRAIGCRSRHWGSKLECHKAQLRILLKQKASIGLSNTLIIS